MTAPDAQPPAAPETDVSGWSTWPGNAPRRAPAAPDAGDVEALAAAINDAEDGGNTTPTYAEMARHLLAFDGLLRKWESNPAYRRGAAAAEVREALGEHLARIAREAGR